MENQNDVVEKLPPRNKEAEKSVLGSLLIDKDAVIKVSDFLRPEDFYEEKNSIIFSSMLELYEKREPIDVVSLANSLTDKGHLDLIGGRSYLVSLANIVPTAGNIIHYAKIVQRKSTLRKLITAAGDISRLGYQEGKDIEKLLDEAEQKLFGISQKYLKQNFIVIKDVLTDAFERIDELHRDGSKLRGIPTGFPDLDNVLAGFQRSDLIILAARPSMGKTSLALDFAKNIAKQKIPVGIFSLEMSKEQLVDRILCSEANVDLWRMRTGKLSDREEDDDFPRIGHAMGVLSEAPLFIDDSPSSNIMEIRTKARRLHAEHGLGFLVVDYLQLMEGRNTESRVQEVSEISRALKGIARELNVPVLALSQLSRAVENRTPQIPQLSDLRESGSIEQDADVVMFIYREEVYKKDTDRKHIAEIHIKKHRNGPTGVVDLFFEQNVASFRNLEKRREI
ncbi:MAG: replicative DNA helicase [Patescibacteria group bacterium]|nr:replicative DNA helicase [Patescibacteria group bacterium]